jgi:acyl-CoA synthetase (AMP-forming)/AMP-acid ligase II
MLDGLMMNTPLTINSIMDFAEKVHWDVEIVSVTSDIPLHRYTYRDAFKRVRKLANALREAGLQAGDRIGTLGWNDYRHFELYYGTTCAGQVCHTINPRLFPEQLDYIINHAENRIIFLDPAFVPILEELQEKLPSVERFIVLTDDQHMPDNTLRNAQTYESFIGQQPDTFNWPEIEEGAASGLCYTSGTTGNPKGVLYSHRATVLHCYAAAMPDCIGLSVNDCIMPIVPMFHVNAWCIPYGAAMVGAKLVLPGPKMGDAEVLHHLMESEGVTLSAGVPTVWLALLNYLSDNNKTIDSLDRILVGGSACPLMIMDEFADKYSVKVYTGWGMTETGPLGTINTMRSDLAALPKEQVDKIRVKQGRPIYGVDLKIEDENGMELPWDGKAFGEIKVRGPWIASDYFKLENSGAHTEDGWFGTGDVATVDQYGYMQITDRTKDVIKSGGEWISSIELENVAVGHPAVLEAAVIGVAHPKWTERPLLLVIIKPGERVEREELLAWFEGKVAKWWIPEDCVFVEELAHTATGKLSKKDLRAQFSGYKYAE